MKKIVLKNCNVKEFNLLIKRSAVMDNLIFLNITGSEFESTAYNRNKSALKSITANLEEYCDGFVNEVGDSLVKIQLNNTAKLIKVLDVIGTEGVDISFFVGDDCYASKIVIENKFTHITVPTADKDALEFLEIPARIRNSIFIDETDLQYKAGITNVEYEYLTKLRNLNSEVCRVFFSINGENITVSEIEGTDDNVRDTVNDIMEKDDITSFESFPKIYSKKLIYDEFDARTSEPYFKCFRKEYFKWIDDDAHYDIEFHTNKIKFVSVDEKGSKTYVVLTPVPFA